MPYMPTVDSSFEEIVLYILAWIILVICIGCIYAFIRAIILFVFSNWKNDKIQAAWSSIRYMILGMFFTIMFVYIFPNIIAGFKPNIFQIELSTIFGQTALLFIAIFTLFSKKNILRISIKELSLRWKYVRPILMLSIPIFLGKFIMSIGKVIVNTMCGSFYGLETGGHIENGVVVDSLIVVCVAV